MGMDMLKTLGLCRMLVKINHPLEQLNIALPKKRWWCERTRPSWNLPKLEEQLRCTNLFVCFGKSHSNKGYDINKVWNNILLIISYLFDIIYPFNDIQGLPKTRIPPWLPQPISMISYFFNIKYRGYPKPESNHGCLSLYQSWFLRQRWRLRLLRQRWCMLAQVEGWNPRMTMIDDWLSMQRCGSIEACKESCLC